MHKEELKDSRAVSPVRTEAAKTVSPVSQSWLIVSGICALLAVTWAYWSTLLEMVRQWEQQPDYSHGYLVIPIAAIFLWTRRDMFPGEAARPSWWGMTLLIAAVVLRVLSGMFYLVPLDGWTLPLTLGGLVWLLYGPAVLKWSWPSIVFLWFMVPIPYSAESMLKVPLQALATKLGTAGLVMLGQPAIAEGNTILLGEHTLFVEEACSGLRIFVGIFALAFAFVLFSRWSLWQKAVTLLVTLPIAIVANVIRIVVTGLLYQYVSTTAGQRFSHDLAGLVMIPLAALLFWLFLIYLDRLFPEVEELRQTAQIYGTSSAEVASPNPAITK